MQLIAYYSVYNEGEYLEYSLKSIYDHVDKIIIIEGAFSETQEGNKRSTDNTIGIITNFPDPQSKILKLYPYNHMSQLDQRSLFFRYAPRNKDYWGWLVDGDEVYTEENIAKIKQITAEIKTFETIRINSYVFVNDYWHYTMIKMPRLFRILANCNYRFIEPNKLLKTLPDGSHHELMEIEFPNIFFHHYSYVGKSSERFLQKRKERINQTGNFKWNIDANGLIYAIGANIRKFTGKHPKLMEEHPKWTKKE
jgi:hypothetical protein